MSGAGVFAVATSTGKFVLRIVHGGDLGEWRIALAAQRLAAAHSIAPAVLYVAEGDRAVVSAKVLGTPLGAAMANPDQRAAVIGSLVAQLAKLHAIAPSDDIIVRGDIIEFARAAWRTQSRRVGFPAWAIPFGSRIDAGATALAADSRRVFSHGDVNPVNAMWDGTAVQFVDWDHAGLSHPYLDLATACNFLMVPTEDANRLLAAQEGAVLAEQLATFAALRDLSRLVYASVFLSLIADLTSVTFTSLAETPNVRQCYIKMATGTLSAAEPRGQAAMAAALIVGTGS